MGLLERGLALFSSNQKLPGKNSDSGLPECPTFQEKLEILLVIGNLIVKWLQLMQNI